MSQGTSCGWCVSIRRGRCLAHSGPGWLQSFFQPKAFVNGCIMMQNDDLSEPKKITSIETCSCSRFILMIIFCVLMFTPKVQSQKKQLLMFLCWFNICSSRRVSSFYLPFQTHPRIWKKTAWKIHRRLSACCLHPQTGHRGVINVEVEFWRCGSLEHRYDEFLRKSKL